MEILLEPTSNKLMVEHTEFDESNTNVLERFYTSAENPVKEILLKLNLPDHRLLKDGGKVKEPQERCIIKLFKITYQERYEHVGAEVTSSQDGKGHKMAKGDDAWLMISRNLDSTSKKFLMYPRFLQLFLNNRIALAEPFNDIYVTPVHTKKVFTNMKRQNKDFSGRITPLFSSMLVPQVVEGESSGQPSEPQPPSSIAPPSQVTTIATQHQKTHKPRRAKRGQDTKIPQSSGPPKKVGDEVVYTGEDDRVVRVATTASSLEAEQESGNIHKTRPTTTLNEPSPQGLGSEGNTSGHGEDNMEHQVNLTDFVPPTPHDSPLSGGHTPGSDEGRPNFNELINLCTQLSNRVLALENSKAAQDLGRKSDKTKPMFNDSDFDVLDDAMENIEGASTAEQITTAGDTLNTASINVNVVGPSHVSTVGPSNVSVVGPSTSTAGDIFKDEMTTIADTLMAIRSARPRTTSVMIHNVEEEPRRAKPVPIVQSQDKGKGKMVEPEPTLKNPRKAQIRMDEELAQRLFKEEQAQFEKEQRIARKKAAEQEAKDAALIEQMEDVQARIDADELLAERLQQKEREQFTVDEQARMLVDLIAERKNLFAAQRAEQIRNKPPTRAQLRNKMINDFVPLDSEMVKDSGKEDGDSQKQAKSSKKRLRAEHDEESVKKQKLDDEAEREELRACLDIVPGDDIAMDFNFSTNNPIID
ncbi:hypothetical protein Tco_1406653 [Tanacetum coccineum]